MIPVPPPQRPVRTRRASRVLIRAGGRVLLIADSDPGIAGSHWWVTPGGGLDAQESWHDAAVRELLEETGLRIDAEDLVGPIAERVVRHGYSDQVLVQHEMFFAVDLPSPFEPDAAGFTEEEQVTLTGFEWFAASQLADITVWPTRLPDLFGARQGDFVDLGEVEESTVPVALGHRES
ncbi:hypothetical protein GCM10009785_14100 [Brooklawnia cerclae]